MVIITKVFSTIYDEEKEILGDGPSGRIIFKSSSYQLTYIGTNLVIPKELKASLQGGKEKKNFILCINGKFLLNKALSKNIEVIFNKLNIKCGICHPGGSHNLNEIITNYNNTFLNNIYLNTYSRENQAKEISNYLKNILEASEENVGKKIEELYYYIYRKKYLSTIKNLITNWLYLAIDIQGLSEVYQKSIKEANEEDWRNKLKEYWGEIEKSGSVLNLWSEHNNIAENYQELKLDINKESKLNIFLRELDSKDRKNLPDEKYLNPESDDFFFPIWLEKYAKRIKRKTEKSLDRVDDR